MSTRSRIGYYDEAIGKIRHVYCHFDGYPSYVGRVLLESYTNINKIKTLIALGDISSLGDNIYAVESYKEHTFDSPVKNVTIFYNRDRGEDFTAPVVETMTEMESKRFEYWADYMYVFRDGHWLYYGGGEEKSWKPLTKEIAEM